MREILCSFLLLCYFVSPLPLTAQERTLGLFTNTEDAYNGYTLLSNDGATYLMDNCGFVVNEWASVYKTGHGMYLLPDGNLLRAGNVAGVFQAGGLGGVFELFDWEGNLLWQYFIAEADFHAHHDIAILPNGNFLCTVWDRKPFLEAREAGRAVNSEVWSESLLEIEIGPNNTANIVWEWSVWDHLVQDHDENRDNFGVVADHPELLDVNFFGEGVQNSGNWLHVNALSYNADYDQIVISSRFMSEIYVIDHSTTTEEAASHSGGTYGKGGDFLYRFGNPQVYDHGELADRILTRQHHIDWAPAGSLYEGAFTVFNNFFIPGEQSQVMIFNNPADGLGHYFFDEDSGYGPDTLIRDYVAPGFYSDILSGVQILPNNNLLVAEGRTGRVFELDQQDEIVWEYVYPVNRNNGVMTQGDIAEGNSIFRAIRYPEDHPAFIGRDLTPGERIELMPLEDDCTVLSATQDPVVEVAENLFVLENPFQDILRINSELSRAVSVTVFDLNGSALLTRTIAPGRSEIDLSMYPSGVFLLRAGSWVGKLIKK